MPSSSFFLWTDAQRLFNQYVQQQEQLINLHLAYQHWLEAWVFGLLFFYLCSVFFVYCFLLGGTPLFLKKLFQWLKKLFSS